MCVLMWLRIVPGEGLDGGGAVGGSSGPAAERGRCQLNTGLTDTGI